ncbi:hypothetical protein AAII07_24045 [Microvirga sp. 0TCS3.31]
MTLQTLDRDSSPEDETSFRGLAELQPLMLSLQSILKQIDDEYERERDRLMRTLPETSAKDRALAMLQSRHLERRKTYVRELAALIGQMP